MRSGSIVYPTNVRATGIVEVWLLQSAVLVQCSDQQLRVNY
ncbi:hypothetical protein [Acinetobacter sp. GSS19]|nr:hypothetical protein [Acinetobacter sp. GSS19]